MTLSRKILSNWEYSLSFILDSTYNAIIAVDQNGYIVVLNESARNLLNLREDVAGQHIEEILPESRIPVVLRTGIAELGHKMVINDRVCFLNLTPIRKGEEVVGAVAVIEDVTLLKRIVDDISSSREAQAILETLMENSQEAIVIVNESGSIVMCNEFFCHYLEIERGKVIGRNVNDILPELPLLNVLISGEPELAQVKLIRGKNVVVSSFPVFDGKKVSGAMAKIIFQNVHEMDPLVNKVNMLRSKLEFYKNQLEKTSGARYRLENIVGKSQVIAQLKEAIKKVAPGNSTVLLKGEAGTGKELFAHVLHLESPRRHKPFIKVNCSTVPENVLEADLFGYIEGAFHGAKKGGLIGKFELANHGTIFFDEISDMSPSLQEKLLKILQEKEIHRIGDEKRFPVDLRVIASTKRNLEELIKTNKFREDLYYRLNVISLYIPPLRERKEDIEALINYLTEKYNLEFGKNVIGISSEVYNMFVKYAWPGNVRELENVMERAFNVIEDQIIQPHHLPMYLKKMSQSKIKISDRISLKTIMEDTERNVLVQALQRTGGNKVKAARLLGISRAGLYQKLEKYSLLDE